MSWMVGVSAGNGRLKITSTRVFDSQEEAIEQFRMLGGFRRWTWARIYHLEGGTWINKNRSVIKAHRECYKSL